MATGSVSGLTMQLQEYFDRLAPSWDEQVTDGSLECLSTIIEELDIKPGDCVLDMGSGTGVLLPFLIQAVAPSGKVVAVDLSAKMLYHAKAKYLSSAVDYIQADGSAIPLSNGCANLAICNSVFPHFSDKARTLREIARVLRDDGRLAICHTMSRKTVNELHQSIGGAVANDLLPDEIELTKLAGQAYLEIVRLEDKPERYLVIAEKRVRKPSNSQRNS